jgi:hypothetical protein
MADEFEKILTTELQYLVPAIAERGVFIRRMRPTEVGELAAIRSRIYAGLPNPDYHVLEVDEAAFCDELLGPDYITVGLFRHDPPQLLGYASLHVETAGSETVQCTQLPNVHWSRAAEAVSCMLDPALRGIRLQRALLNMRERIGWRMGRSLIQVTVSPYNAPSRHNLLVSGYRLVWSGRMPNPDRYRYIFEKDLLDVRRLTHRVDRRTGQEDLANTQQYSALAYEEVRILELTDVTGLREAIELGLWSINDTWIPGKLVFARIPHPKPGVTLDAWGRPSLLDHWETARQRGHDFIALHMNEYLAEHLPPDRAEFPIKAADRRTR